MQTKPHPHGICFIVHTKNNPADAWSKAKRFCGSAEEHVRQLQGLTVIPLEITKYENGVAVDTYEVDSE